MKDWRVTWSQPVMIVAGGVLLFAAFAKLAAHFDPVHVALHSDFELAMWSMIAGVELMLAIWTFSGKSQFHCQRTLIAVFFIFSMVNTAFLIAGRGSCNCLGRFEVTPGVMLAVDFVVLLALISVRPAEGALAIKPVFTRKLLGLTGILVALSLGFTFFLGARTESLRNRPASSSRLMVPVNDRTQIALATLLDKITGFNRHWREQLVGTEQLFLLITRESCDVCATVLGELARDENRPKRYEVFVLHLPAEDSRHAVRFPEKDFARLGIPYFIVMHPRYEIVTRVPAVVKYSKGRYQGYRGGIASWQPF